MALTQHFQIAAYLGECELALGRSRDAAEHLAYALDEPADQTPPEQRSRLASMLDSARAKVARLTIAVDVDGATILVDGRPIGSSPLPKPIFVEPGAVTVQAVHDGDGLGRARWSRDVAAGADEVVTLSMKVAPGAPRTSVSADSADAGRRPPALVDDSRSVLPLILGSALTVVGAAVGVGFTLAATSKSDDVDRQDADLVERGVHCPAGSNAPECRAIFDAAATRDTLTGAAIACYAGAAVAAAGGVVWYVLQAPASQPSRSATGARAQLVVVPHPRSPSAGLAGRF